MTTSSFPREGLGEATAPERAAAPELEAEPKVLDHVYDGIQEFDNPMPRWWVRVFWATFIFSIGYAFHFHVSGNGASVLESYRADEQRAAEVQSRQALAEAPSEATLATLMNDAKLMESASVVFGKRCAACHAEAGQGLIGPNLTDEHWIHGTGTLMNIYEVVSQGVLEKGMPAWQSQLEPGELRKLVAFVGTLRGKNLPGKPPQGERVTQP